MPIYETMKFDNMENERTKEVQDIICAVYNALKVKGYNPVSQLVGYILSGDPTYITNYNNARSIINRVERDEILEELVKNYLKSCKQYKNTYPHKNLCGYFYKHKKSAGIKEGQIPAEYFNGQI